MQRSDLHYMPPTKMANHLEVELVDVCTVENGWRAKQDHVIGANCILTQLASREHLADIPLDLAFNQQGRDIIGQIAHIARVPQLKALDRAIFHVLVQLTPRTETCQGHLAA